MKTLSFSFFFTLCSFISFSQGVWTQKASFGGGVRVAAIGFAIGDKGYIGTGSNGSVQQDLWQWNQATNTWTQKSNLTGVARSVAISFSIDDKGYIGTGNTNTSALQDFWEYDTLLNSWTQKATFPGVARVCAVSFSINHKGYIATGSSKTTPQQFYQDFWEYDQLTNVWSQKSSFPGLSRDYAVAFSIGQKGYLGTGRGSSYFLRNDFWEYDQVTDAWTQKANFGGTARALAVGFSIGSKGYIGTGCDSTSTVKKDFWEYNPNNNTWTQQADLTGVARLCAVGFSILGKGYIGTGKDNSINLYLDFWEWIPSGVGIPEPSTKLEYTLYPNPMSESVTLEIADGGLPIADLNFELYDLQSKRVYQSEINNPKFAIQRGNLSAGTYIYTITNENKVLASGKLIIQ